MGNDIKQGAVCIVNCDPSIGREYKKIRPAIVIQADEITKKSKLITVVPLSSKIGKRDEDDFIIKKDNINNLAVDSVVKTKQISTFDKKRIIQPIGMVGDSAVLMIKAYLLKHFGLSN